MANLPSRNLDWLYIDVIAGLDERSDIMNKQIVLSAAVAAGLLGLVAPAYAQYQENPTYWNGNPNAPGPTSGPAMYGNSYGPDGQFSYGPNYGGWEPGYGGNNVGRAPQPYWLGAPQATGPGA
jgi:hypothetical protein